MAPNLNTAPDIQHINKLHAPFLERAAASESDPASGCALGAFLTLRLIDYISDETASPDALRYQVRSAREYLADLQSHGAETQHLQGIVDVVDAIPVRRQSHLLWPPLLAYAFWLEHELRLEEALDVLETSLVLSDARPDDVIAAHLQRGRVLRLLGRFEEARRSYTSGERLAEERGDPHSVLLGRIGTAIVLQEIGNLPDAERLLRDVLARALELGDTDAEARAYHELSAALHYMRRGTEAVPLAYRAFELYDHPLQRARALSDTGTMLKELGHYSAAKNALMSVLDQETVLEVRYRAMVELLELSALVQDRFSFERWRRELEAGRDQLPLDERVEFAIKLGNALVAFDRRSEGESQLRRALTMAEEYGLGERVFRAEEALRELEASPASAASPMARRAETTPAPELQPTIEGLATLRAPE